MMSRITSRHWKISTGCHFQNGRHNTAQIQLPVTLSDFNDISYVGRLWCPKFIPDIEQFLAVTIFKNGCHNTAQIQHCPISYVGRLWCPELIPDIEKFLPVAIFKNGHHNTAQIQHCPISTTFHMWVDYDVPKWFRTSKNVYRSPFSKWPPQYRTNSTLFDFKGSFSFIF